MKLRYNKEMKKIEASVRMLLGSNDGHGYDHVERVRDMALKFARREGANLEVVELASLLHDIDDYKLFGEESARLLTNANKILDENSIDEKVCSQVIEIISTIGYNKYLEGIRPTTLEGKIISDADMCDAIGVEGILRTYLYNTSKGKVFFDKSLLPESYEISAIQYRNKKSDHAVQHFFDKLLRIPSILMTHSGCEEGSKRMLIMIDFLRELFREEDAGEWTKHLNHFLKK